MAKQQPIHVAIVGGGIGGLTFAVGLAKFEHITFTIYESAAEFAEIGAGIGFGSNSNRAMSLISPKIQQLYDKVLTTNGWESKSRVWFDFQLGEDLPASSASKISSARTATVPAGTHICSPLLNLGERQSTCHRAHLLDELISLLPDNVAVFNKRLVDIKQDMKGARRKVELSFGDGTKAEADCAVGCDGIRSVCRSFVIGKDHPLLAPEFTGKHAYRGLIDMDRAVEVLGEEKARNRQMYIGRDGHILTFPIAKGSLMNVVAFHESNKRVWEGEWVKAVDKKDMMREFDGWGKEATAILNLLEPDLWALHQVSPLLPAYHNRRLVLLGDSAHATTPHQGSGAGMAIEDGYILHNLLGTCTSASDIEFAFEAYEAVRMPRCRSVIETSLQQGRLLEMEHEKAGEDLQEIAKLLDTTTRYVWNIDLPLELEKAMKRFVTARREAAGRRGRGRRESFTLPWPCSEKDCEACDSGLVSLY